MKDLWLLSPWGAFIPSPRSRLSHLSTNVESRKKLAVVTRSCARRSMWRTKFGRFYSCCDLSDPCEQKRKGKSAGKSQISRPSNCCATLKLLPKSCTTSSKNTTPAFPSITKSSSCSSWLLYIRPNVLHPSSITFPSNPRRTRSICARAHTAGRVDTCAPQVSS